MAHCLILCCSSHATHSMVPSRDGLETSIIIFAIAFTRFAVMGVAHFTSGAHFGLPSPTIVYNTFLHISRIQFVDLIFYQCSGVVDGTWYIMPNTTFRIFVICSGHMQFILCTCIVIMDSTIWMKCCTLKILR